MNSVKLHWDAFKSMSDIHKIHLQRLGLPIALFHLILSTNELYLCKYISLKKFSIFNNEIGMLKKSSNYLPTTLLSIFFLNCLYDLI